MYRKPGRMLRFHHWNVLIKTVVVLAFGAFLIHRFTTHDHGGELWQTFLTQWASGSSWLIVLVVMLMPMNWLMEIIKWRVLMFPSVKLSWRRATAGVLSGITFSLFTPNRVGDYGGRILYVGPKHTWQAVVASLTGSFAQNLVHVSFGMVAVLVMISSTYLLPQMMSTGLWILVSCIVGVAWIVYLRLPNVARISAGFKPPRFLQKPWKALSHVSETTHTQLATALGLALLRYLIFSLQYVLLLKYFGIDIPWIWLAGGVAVIYLMHTSIPLPPFADLVARNELGILLWAGFGVNEVSIVAAGFSIWIINLVLPALFGLLAIATVNVLSSLGYDNEAITSTPPQPSARVLGRTTR